MGDTLYKYIHIISWLVHLGVSLFSRKLLSKGWARRDSNCPSWRDLAFHKEICSTVATHISSVVKSLLRAASLCWVPQVFLVYFHGKVSWRMINRPCISSSGADKTLMDSEQLQVKLLAHRNLSARGWGILPVVGYIRRLHPKGVHYYPWHQTGILVF